MPISGALVGGWLQVMVSLESARKQAQALELLKITFLYQMRLHVYASISIRMGEYQPITVNLTNYTALRSQHPALAEEIEDRGAGGL